MNAPRTATHYLPARDGKPQLFYRQHQWKDRHGKLQIEWEYQTFTGAWHISLNPNTQNLIPLPNQTYTTKTLK